MANKTITKITTSLVAADLDSTKYFPVGDSDDDSTAKVPFTELKAAIAGSVSTPKCVLSWAQAGAFSNTTHYITFGLAAVTQATDNYKISLPACTLRNLKIHSSAHTGAGSSVFTVRKNGIDTALVATVLTTALTAKDAVNSVVFAEDDEVSVKCVAPSGNTITNLGISVVAELS